MIKTKLTIYNIVNKVYVRRFNLEMPIQKISDHNYKALPKIRVHGVCEVLQ